MILTVLDNLLKLLKSFGIFQWFLYIDKRFGTKINWNDFTECSVPPIKGFAIIGLSNYFNNIV